MNKKWTKKTNSEKNTKKKCLPHIPLQIASLFIWSILLKQKKAHETCYWINWMWMGITDGIPLSLCLSCVFKGSCLIKFSSAVCYFVFFALIMFVLHSISHQLLYTWHNHYYGSIYITFNCTIFAWNACV